MKKYLIMLFVALAAGFQSCDNNDDLWAAIGDLKSRVQALETQVDALNKNIEALGKLYGGSSISDVKVESGKYVITLSNGEKIELTQGSKADAKLPQIGIDKDGFWQVSYDEGKSFTKLDVKASASNGTTPQFRIEETTGYWQVSYDEGKIFVNVLDTANKPVSAVGSSTMTDKFFENVEVKDGVLEITLIGETEPLRVPIVKDFLCEIVVATPGVQKFTLGETKTFEVKIKGVVRAEITAPEGWKASLSDAVADKATLTVTAPATVTRATADNTKDVTISAESASYLSTMAKIEVELSGAAPVMPVAGVTNSMVTLPTSASLTFDVTTTNADGWKYICQKSSETAPDAAKVFADGTAGTGTSVTVDNLTASTAYTIYVVAYKGTETGVLALIENTTSAAVVTAGDYYQDYLDGKDLVIGSLTVNKTAFPNAQKLMPAEITNDILKAGGLIFVDNSNDAALAGALTGSSADIARTAALVLIGQYKEKKQAKITVSEFRCNQNITLLNLHVIAATDNTFTTTNAQSLNPELQIVDCTINALRYMIYDNNASWSFGKVLIDNSIISFPEAANTPSVFGITTAVKTNGYPHESIKMTNSVVYCSVDKQTHLINIGNTMQYNATNLTIEVTGNTFYNLYQPNVLVRAGVVKGVIMTGNVGYVDYTSLTVNPTYLMCVYFNTADAGISTVAGNYLYSLSKATATKDKAPWVLVHNNNKVTVAGQDQTTIVDGDTEPNLNPFSSTDIAKGYFPINKSVVTNDAGASYDTKKWIR